MEGGVASCAEPLIEKTCQNELGNNSSRFLTFLKYFAKKRKLQDQLISFIVECFFFNGDFVCIMLSCLTLGVYV